MAPTLTYQADLFGFAYAGLTLLGGVIGLVKAGSIPSLVSPSLSLCDPSSWALSADRSILHQVASAVCAALIYIGVDRTSRDPRDVRFILAVSLLLSGFFGNKYRKSGKVMPGLVMTVFSLASVARYGLRLL